MDYARQCNHTKCVEILTEAGGVGTEDIRGMAALTIQTAYRGYRCLLHHVTPCDRILIK